MRNFGYVLFGAVMLALFAGIAFAVSSGSTSSVPAKPDLKPVNARFYVNPQWPDYIFVDAYETNIGSATAGEQVQAISMLNGGAMYWFYLSSLAPGQTVWTGNLGVRRIDLCPPGVLRARADIYADYYHQVAESNENNNIMTIYYDCTTRK